MNRTLTLVEALHDWAVHRPDRTAVAIGDESVTYAQLSREVTELASGLSAQGISSGDTVAMLMGNSLDMTRMWLALTHVGAVAAPINTAFRGSVLTHVINLAAPALLVVDAELLPAVSRIEEEITVSRVAVRGRTDVSLRSARALSLDELAVSGQPAAEEADVQPSDPAMLLFTSGTTGRSKACVLSHRYLVRQAEIFFEQLSLRGDDVLFSPFPLFHADAAIFTVAPALLHGATAALEKRFSASQFWSQARRHGATVFDYMGATLAMLSKQPPSADDKNHSLRLGWGVPLPSWAPEFEDRFGVELVEVYGLTDAGIVLYNKPGEPRREGSCGKAVPPFTVRILDKEGFPVSPGETGEICIRSDEPGLLMTQYLGMPDETLKTFRNQWLHTGDLARCDGDGYFFFIGRDKDVIRRRGENVSAFEVEEVLNQHPAVLEVAVIAVPSPLTEEEVKACVALRDGETLTPEQFMEFATSELPRFMVPRYMEFYDGLPKTPTEKVEKYKLLESPFTDLTIDLGIPKK